MLASTDSAAPRAFTIKTARALRLLRKLKGACACRGQPQPVIVAHDAFDDAHAAAAAVFNKQRAQRVVRKEERVEVRGFLRR